MADEKVTVTALGRLVHNGRIVEAGEEVEVFAHDVDRLVEVGVAEVAGAVKRAVRKARGKSDSGAEDSSQE